MLGGPLFTWGASPAWGCSAQGSCCSQRGSKQSCFLFFWFRNGVFPALPAEVWDAAPPLCADPHPMGSEGWGVKDGVRKGSKVPPGGTQRGEKWVCVKPAAKERSRAALALTLLLCLPRSTTCMAGGSGSSTAPSGSSPRITWQLLTTWRSGEDGGAQVRGGTPAFVRWGGSAAPFSPRTVWLHLLVSVLHGRKVVGLGNRHRSEKSHRAQNSCGWGCICGAGDDRAVGTW